MAFKLVKRNKLRVPVKGTLSDEDGKPVAFSFVLLCDRLSQSEIEAALANKSESVKEFLQKVTNGWEDILTADSTPMEFSPENFGSVLEEQAGLAGVCFQAYMKEVGAVAKN